MTGVGPLVCVLGVDGKPCGNVPGPAEKFRTGHPQNGAHCPACYLNNAGRVAQVHRPPEGVDSPCIHRGKQLNGSERHQLHSLGQTHISHERTWFLCGREGFVKHGRAVSGCHDHAGQYGCGFGCPEYERPAAPPPKAPEPAGRRHLAMHVYPSVGNNTWRRSLDQVRARWPVFTGVKAIAVVVGGNLTPFETVRDYCEGWGADVFPMENNAGLREVVTWADLWTRVLAVAGPNDTALYCHAKGTSRPVDPGNMCHRWSSLLWSLMLDWVPDIDALLKLHPIVGCFKKVGYGFGRSHGRWHYSGSFFWAKIGDFRERYKMPPPNIWYGVEAWPGMAYDAGESGTFYRETPVSKTNLYEPKRWQDVYLPEYAAWLTERRVKANDVRGRDAVAQ